ncbi:hypothetical protein [Streptomyces sp. NPDC058424]|uniref:hypothetical protein n=1 Tax=Streptomyces sp. NPDC058424 TaxID=3346491 RepID=UPI003666677D
MAHVLKIELLRNARAAGIDRVIVKSGTTTEAIYEALGLHPIESRLTGGIKTPRRAVFDPAPLITGQPAGLATAGPRRRHGRPATAMKTHPGMTPQSLQQCALNSPKRLARTYH